MKKRHIALITLLLANSVLGEDGVELLKRHYLIDMAICLTPVNKNDVIRA